MLANNNLKLLAFVSLLFLLLPLSSWAQITLNDCDGDFVNQRPGELIIDVLPTGIDDTLNIQCALEVAVNVGFPIVSLSAGDFFISHIFAESFNGSLQGTTRVSTRVHVLDDSIDCSAMIDQGLTPAAIKFSQGEPNLKFMQVSANAPCKNSWDLDILIHFTGKNANDPGCGFSVINGRVDRVDVLGPGHFGDVTHGIAASAEGDLLGGCNVALLGGIKINKSSISEFTIGAFTAMRSGAQVDINFTKFMHNWISINVFESNQSATVTTNEFYLDESPPIIENSSVEGGNRIEHNNHSGAVGILVQTFIPTPPAKTRLVIDNNKFYFSSTDPNEIIDGIHVADFVGGHQVVSLAATNNVFNLDGPNIAGIWIDGVDNAAISANRFNGTAFAGIGLSTFQTPAASGSTITANLGFAAFNGLDSDIRIEPGITQAIVGPGQDAVVKNLGSGNTILSVSPIDNDTGLQAESYGKTREAQVVNRTHAVRESLARLMELRRRH